jgi:hypothetical protein
MRFVADPVQPLMQAANDDDCENIEPIDISEIITFNSPLSNCPDLRTGFYGEKIVYDYLRKLYSSPPNSAYIKWENEYEESNSFYDILLTKNGKKHYIEVKSTRANDQHLFQLSINQIEAILEHKHYFIYRVYIIKNKLIILNNIWQRLRKQQLSLSLEIKPQWLNKFIDIDQ